MKWSCRSYKEEDNSLTQKHKWNWEQNLDPPGKEEDDDDDNNNNSNKINYKI